MLTVICHCQTGATLRTFHAPQLRTPALDRIENFFDNYKSHINNKLISRNWPDYKRKKKDRV